MQIGLGTTEATEATKKAFRALLQVLGKLSEYEGAKVLYGAHLRLYLFRGIGLTSSHKNTSRNDDSSSIICI